MDSRYLLLSLLTLQIGFTVTAERKFGCLFEESLCKKYEFCVNDGMFGHCQVMMGADMYMYDITPATLQRFRSLLQKLSVRGLSWEDDVTQQVLANEFSKLRKISLPPPDSRPVVQSVTVGNGRLKDLEVELTRSLQKYLLNLGLLPKQGSQVSNMKSSLPLEYYRSGKTRNKVDSAPPEFTPESTYQQASYPDLTYYQSDSASAPAQQNGPGVLVTALKQYLSQNNPLKPDQGARQKLNTVFMKGGSSQSSARDPLTPIDETFIRNVLRNVGKHNVDVESLSTADLNQLAALIADALQVVEQQAEQGYTPRDVQEENQTGDLQTGDLQTGDDTGDQNVSETSRQQSEETSSLDQKLTSPSLTESETREEERSVEDHSKQGLLTKLLEYLDKDSRSERGPLGKGRGISIETVRSRTTQRDVGMQKKAMEQVEEVEGWVQAAALAPAPVLEDDAATRRKHTKVTDLQLDVQSNTNSDVYGYIITDVDSIPTDQAVHLMELLSHKAKIQMTDFLELSVIGPAVTFQVRPNAQNVTTADVANVAVRQKDTLEKEARVTIVEAGVTDKDKLSQIPTKYSRSESLKFLILTVISIVCIIGVLLVSIIIYCVRHRSHHKLKEKLTNLGTDPATEATATYQELCRQRMAVKPSVERSEPRHSSRINSVSSQLSDGPMPSPSARASISSWSEEPAHSNMDISTGHMILSYMEDHLKNKNRLEKEWEALCAYHAEPNTCSVGQRDSNTKKNRFSSIIPYDHSRICLKVENSQANCDYINASPIMDHDPRNPAYIATQGPLPSTVADFWQMVWESGCVVIVMLTPLTESGVKQCYHYWPDEGSNLYHIYEVNLVSEHVWCEDFLVRSFYLKNMQTNESRTVTQFHYHTWLNQHTPETNQALLDFRRKVNKCYRGRSCPIIVHCSDGAGRTGTYILIDMVLNKMAKGAKEIDIAATLEHLRDQRPGMVQTKEQFEFALTAVAEEVNVILKALPQ
ncbi:solute carrier organic anion transporter family member 5A1b [Brachyhypopomus gauderio]|uniref:solute carrier organic anion transporter family member 5A1b n=1 Tax=Brachyhypopomus gauderio TaxID=698409 RepID=UPI004040EBFA